MEASKKVEVSKETVTIDLNKISEYRARKIGEAFYNAYMEFMSDPENAAMIEREIEEDRAKNPQKAVEAEECADAPVKYGVITIPREVIIPLDNRPYQRRKKK